MKHLFQLILEQSNNMRWMYKISSKSIDMYVEISTDLKLLITLISEEKKGQGIIVFTITTKSQLMAFMLFVGGSPKDPQNHILALGCDFIHCPKVVRKEGEYPDMEASQASNYNGSISVTSNNYKTMLPLIQHLSTCNISDTLLKGGFLHLLS